MGCEGRPGKGRRWLAHAKRQFDAFRNRAGRTI